MKLGHDIIFDFCEYNNVTGEICIQYVCTSLGQILKKGSIIEG
jgi:hypothetical protein